MEPLETTPHHEQGGIYNYFEGATIHNLVINGSMTRTGSEHYHAVRPERPRPTAEQLARALEAINGEGRAVRNYQDWLGACCLLSSKYGYPLLLADCVEQVNRLPFREGGISVECRLDNLRRFGNNRFVNIDVDKWPSYEPNEQEQAVFKKSFAVARALDDEIQKLMAQS